MTTPTDCPINPVTGMTEQALESLLAEPMLAYHPDVIAAMLDEQEATLVHIARLQSDEPTDDAEVIAEAHRLYPAWHQWPERERYRAVASGRISDEPDADEDELVYDDLAS